MNRFALLDRDGTIIIDKVYLNNPDSVEFAPGAIEGLHLLRDAGFTLLLLTNQSGIARGYLDEMRLSQIHGRLEALLAREELKLARIYYCPHGPDDCCECRKPALGMVTTAMADFGFQADDAVVIGDSRADSEMAAAAGMRCIRIGSDTECASNFYEAARRALSIFG